MPSSKIFLTWLELLRKKIRSVARNWVSMEPNFSSNIKIMKRKIVCFLFSYVKIFYLTQSYTRNVLICVLTRKQSTPNFPKNESSLSPDTHTCRENQNLDLCYYVLNFDTWQKKRDKTKTKLLFVE